MSGRNVAIAQHKLAEKLTMAGASVLIATGSWSVEKGKGMDDYIQQNGAERFKELLLSAKTLEAWENQFKEPAEGVRKGKHLPADKMALSMIDAFQDKLAFNDVTGQWMRYEAKQPGMWAAATDVFVEAIISKTLDSRGVEGYGSHSYVVNIVKKLRSLLILPDWDENHVLSIDDDTVTRTLNGSVKQPMVELLSLHQRIDTDSVCWWVNEYVIRDKSAKTQIGNKKDEARDAGIGNVVTLFGSYYQRCLDAGKSPKSVTEFSRHLLDLTNNILGWKEIERQSTKACNVISGLRLRETGKDEEVPTMLDLLTKTNQAECSTVSSIESQQGFAASTTASTITPTIASTIENLATPLEEPLVEETRVEAKVEPVVEVKVEPKVEAVNPCPEPIVEGAEDEGKVVEEYVGFREGERVRVNDLDSKYYGMEGTVMRNQRDAWVNFYPDKNLPKGEKPRKNFSLHESGLVKIDKHGNLF